MVYHPPYLVRTKCVILLSALLQTSLLFAQTENYTIEAIPKTAELSDITVKCVLQDSEGFMWLGTTTGLHRYDGREYKNFRHNTFDVQTLQSDIIRGIAEDSANVLWIETGGSLDRFDIYHERIERDISVFFQIRNILDDKKGNLWFGTHMSGLIKYEKGSNQITIEFKFDPTDSTLIWETRPLLMDRNGIIWLLSHGPRLWRYYPESGSIEELNNVPCEFGTLLEDRSGRIWITSECGLYLFDRDNNTFKRQLYQINNPNRLYDVIVCSILEDNHWRVYYRDFFNEREIDLHGTCNKNLPAY